MNEGVEYVGAKRRSVGFVGIRSLVPRVSVHFGAEGKTKLSNADARSNGESAEVSFSFDAEKEKKRGRRRKRTRCWMRRVNWTQDWNAQANNTDVNRTQSVANAHTLPEGLTVDARLAIRTRERSRAFSCDRASERAPPSESNDADDLVSVSLDATYEFIRSNNKNFHLYSSTIFAEIQL